MSTTDSNPSAGQIDPRAQREHNAHDGELIRLSDARTYFADKKQDIRGRKVVDSHGHEIGVIDGLMLDNDQHHVRFMQVRTRTGFLGLHRHTATIPVDAIVRVEAEAVYLGHSKQSVEAGPKLVYDPKMLDKRTLQGVYTYYGYAPFWDPFYVAPLFHSHPHPHVSHLHHH
jgi:sporulation protein YlmC with PRC-barrel domain